ncbi:hypothetical protein BgAZ_402700 [Babesia gibsoni]|uniref:RSE1/DDB1/CPSF1 C-terminal domain-containing protein n=1 Tax=Babesia gibsoni TaxID=33632 RepID=A0AAD8LRH1_BABGI|nr:hypothetical protein BgAZ_402700 [Babesia gibsoni]
MDGSTGLAYQTICDATSADSILYGSFRYPLSQDVVVIKGQTLSLYTFLLPAGRQGPVTDTPGAACVNGKDNDDGGRRIRNDAAGGHIRFISQIKLFGHPIGAHALADCIFYSYERTSSSKSHNKPDGDPTSAGETGDLQRGVDDPDSILHEEDQELSSEDVLASSAILLAFDDGRLCLIAFDGEQNRFVTLSMHVLDRRSEAVDEAQYLALPLRDKLRLTTVTDTYVSVCNCQGWYLLSRKRDERQRRVTVYARRFIIAYCYDERVVTLLSLSSEFSRPFAVKKHTYQPFSEYIDCTSRQLDGDHHSIVMVPWLRVESVYDMNVDSKLGFCDGRYFLRGMSFCFENNLAVLGMLIVTKPEAVGTHQCCGVESTIGGMSFVSVSINPHIRCCTTIQRVDALPLDTEVIMGVQPSVFGTAGFIFRSLDYVMWTTLMDPTLYKQLVSAAGVIGATIDDERIRDDDLHLLDARCLNLDLRDYDLDFVGELFLLLPLSKGDVYIGRPVTNSIGVLSDILWLRTGGLDCDVSTWRVLRHGSQIELFAAGSGFDIAHLLINIPEEFLGFNECQGECVMSRSYDTAFSASPNDVTSISRDIYERLTRDVKPGCISIEILVVNNGVMHNPKNVTLPEMWQIGCKQPCDTGNSEDIPLSEHVIPRFKPQRRPYITNDRQIGVVGVDYVWPKQQSIVALRSDSSIAIIMEKVPLQQVISVPLQSNSTLIPLLNNNCGLDGTAGKSKCLRGSKFLITWGSHTAAISLDESILEIQADVTMDRRMNSKDATGPADLSIITDEYTLVYASVGEHKYIAQVTRTRIYFIDAGKCMRVGSRNLTDFDIVSGSTLKAAEIQDNHVICHYTSGNMTLLKILFRGTVPELVPTHRIVGGCVILMTLYKPIRINHVFCNTSLLILTASGSLFCYELDSFERLFAFSGIHNVYPQLFNEESEHLDIIYMEKQGDIRKDNTNKRQSSTIVSERKKRSTSPLTKSRVSYSTKRNSHTQSSPCIGNDRLDDNDVFRSSNGENGVNGGAALNAASDNHCISGLHNQCGHLRSAVSRWLGPQHLETLEHILSIQLLDIAPTDEGPTFVMFITGRPLIIYRSYFVDCKDIVFQMHHHRYVVPLPSAAALVEEMDGVRELVAIKILHDRAAKVNNVNRPHVSIEEYHELDKRDVNYASLSYPHLMHDEVQYCLFDVECNRVTSSGRPLTKSQIEERPALKRAVEALERRWKNFTAPCLKLTSTNNRLTMHEYDIDNVIDIDSVFGTREAQISSVFSVVTYSKHLARYLLLLTHPGNLVLCIPGILDQKTAINGKVTLKEIVGGSDEPDLFPSRNENDILWNPLYCHLKNDSRQYIKADMFCRSMGKHAEDLSFNGSFISQMYSLGKFRAHLLAVSDRNYYLSNNVIRANRNATIATLPFPNEIHEVYCGRLVAIVVKYDVNARNEFVEVLNGRIDLQLRQLQFESLPTGKKPIDIIEPNKQICTLIETLDDIPMDGGQSQAVWREMVLVLHMANLHYWLGEYEVEPMESVLSMTFGIIGNREYLLLGTCTNLGENVESKGEVIVIDLQPLYQRQPNMEKGVACLPRVSSLTRAPTCATLVQHCKRIFPGAVSFISSLNSDFDVLFRRNNDHQIGDESRGPKSMAGASDDTHRWTMSHFSPNFGIFVHSVGSRLFVHEVSGKQFVRGAFAEVPLCVSSACVFDKYVVAGDINMGLHFFMYRHDAMNDSRTLCKIGSTVRKVDLSIVACAPLTNDNCIGLIASDYFANLILFKNMNDDHERETLVVDAAVRLPTRVTHFVRREKDFRGNKPSGVLGFNADGSSIYAYMPESEAYTFLRTLQGVTETLVAAPLGVPRAAFSSPLFTSQMLQTQPLWPNDEATVSLDVLSSLPFQTAELLDTVTSKMSGESVLSSYQVLNTLSSFLV